MSASRVDQSTVKAKVGLFLSPKGSTRRAWWESNEVGKGITDSVQQISNRVASWCGPMGHVAEEIEAPRPLT